MPTSAPPSKTKIFLHYLSSYFWIAIGTFIFAIAIKIFLIPANLIDGGVVGVSMICSTVLGKEWLPLLLIIFNLPFVIFAWREIGKIFVVHMLVAVVLLGLFVHFLQSVPPFEGDILEVIVFGGLGLGIGVGLVIRMGGALDGTEILAIVINHRRGYTVGQVVFFFNIFIFAVAGYVYGDWHAALRSFMTYIVAYKIMDTVIVGLDQMKSVTIISTQARHLANLLIHKLGLGVTIMYGRGGFSGEQKEIIYVIVERLQIAELKELIHREDPDAFIAIEDIHEVITGKQDMQHTTRKKITKAAKKLFS
jgi:uncharacterized membrane-anchored protein YitT (DUF2179 family)